MGPTRIFEWAFDKGRHGSPDASLQRRWVGTKCNSVSHRATFLVLSEAWRSYHGPLFKSTVLLSSPLYVEHGWYPGAHLARPKQICQIGENPPVCAVFSIAGEALGTKSVCGWQKHTSLHSQHSHRWVSPWHQEPLEVVVDHLIAESFCVRPGESSRSRLPW